MKEIHGTKTLQLRTSGLTIKKMKQPRTKYMNIWGMMAIADHRASKISPRGFQSWFTFANDEADTEGASPIF
jgi:hypothetical protein